MNSSGINSLSELDAEIARLKALSTAQEEELILQLKGVEEYIQPHNMVKRTVRGLFSNTASNRSFYAGVISAGIDILLQRFTGKHETGLVQSLGRSLLGKAAGSLAASGYEAIVEKIRSLFSKGKDKAIVENADDSDASDGPIMKMGNDEI